MPIIVGLFLRAIGWSIVPLGWKLVKGLGFAAISYTGITIVMNQAKDFVFSQLSAVPADWLQVLGLLKVDVCINILFSVYVARAIMWGLDRSGSKTSIKWLGK